MLQMSGYIILVIACWGMMGVIANVHNDGIITYNVWEEDQNHCHIYIDITSDSTNMENLWSMKMILASTTNQLKVKQPVCTAILLWLHPCLKGMKKTDDSMKSQAQIWLISLIWVSNTSLCFKFRIPKYLLANLTPTKTQFRLQWTYWTAFWQLV